MQAPYYAMRMNYQAIASCSSYPCTKSPLYGLDSGSMTFDSEAARNTTLDSLLPLAAAEYNLEEQLMQVGAGPRGTDGASEREHCQAMLCALPASRVGSLRSG